MENRKAPGHVGKRQFIPVFAFLVIGLLLTGCGSDIDRARGFVENGDAVLAGVKSRFGSTAGSIDEMFDTVSVSMSQGEEPDAGALEEDITTIKREISDEAGDAGRARSEFEKVDGLSGVDDYQDYARLRVAAIDTFLESVVSLEGYLDSALKTLRSDEFDPAELLGAADVLSEEMESLGEKTAALEKKAGRLKDRRGL